jgi:two-component system NarL family sensor kinase
LYGPDPWEEALQNAMKHSGTRHFEVSLIGRSNAIELTVRDWGIGFSPEQATQNPGLGLTSMSERLKLVGGELFIDSPDGGGTLVRVVVPLSTYRVAKA